MTTIMFGAESRNEDFAKKQTDRHTDTLTNRQKDTCRLTLYMIKEDIVIVLKASVGGRC